LEEKVAPTPNVNTHRFSISYTVDGLTHKVQHWCKAVESGGDMYMVSTDETLMLFDTYVGQWDTYFGPCLPADAEGAGAVLYERVEGTFVPVAAADWTPSPSVHALVKASGIYITYRDIQQVRMNLVFEEMWYPVPYLTRSYTGITDAAWAAFVISQLGTVDSTHLGGFVRSLAGNPQNVFKSFVVDTNEKLRRKRGLK
jgi:hypothetical protein